MDSGRSIGGSLKLRELIEEHTSELAYDFRSKFGLSYLEIGHSVTWLEAYHLILVLMKEPDSWLQASVRKWKYPVTNEWVVAAHTYDLLAHVNSGKRKPRPYPTPWSTKEDKIRPKHKQSRSSVIDKLKKMNPKENNGS